jgi:hypothetical protein
MPSASCLAAVHSAATLSHTASPKGANPGTRKMPTHHVSDAHRGQPFTFAPEQAAMRLDENEPDRVFSSDVSDFSAEKSLQIAALQSGSVGISTA